MKATNPKCRVNVTDNISQAGGSYNTVLPINEHRSGVITYHMAHSGVLLIVQGSRRTFSATGPVRLRNQVRDNGYLLAVF